MTAFLSWYVAVQILGSIGYLLLAPHSRRLPDYGYASSKTLGVFLCGFLLWVGTTLGLLRNELGGAALVVLSLAAIATAQYVRTRGSSESRPWLPAASVLITTELLFLIAFGGWCMIRSFNPSANHTEQPMDLMLLTATSNSPTFPPADPWLAGYPIGYYYLGHWFLSTVGHLSGQSAAVSYNVGQACWFGLLITTWFGLGFNLTSLGGVERSPRRVALAAGTLTAVAVAVMSNLRLPVEWMAARLQNGTFTMDGLWWWRSSRVVQDVDLAERPIEVITEFPFFSYLLGDNHAHMLSMPFVALAATAALNLLLVRAMPPRDRAAARTKSAGAGRKLAWVPLALAAATCSALIPLNTWDFPAAFLLLAITLFGVPAITRRDDRLYALPALGLILFLGPMLNVPFLLTAQSQVEGLLPNLFHPTALQQFLIMFGTVAPGVALLLHVAWSAQSTSIKHVATLAVAGIALCGAWLVAGAYWTSRSSAGTAWLQRVARDIQNPLSLSLDRWLGGWPVILLVIVTLSVAVALLWGHTRSFSVQSAGRTFGLALATVGLVLVLMPEVVYIHDSFANRMNTVFKFYNQAWLFLGVASALGIALCWVSSRAGRVAAIVALLPMAAGLAYAPAAVSSTSARTTSVRSLDALEYTRREQPDVHAAINWVRSSTHPAAIIVQAPGNSYDALDGIISTATARPTLIGWQAHERQWRGRAYDAMSAGRLEALARIYNSKSNDDLQQTLLAWNVSYVYLGPTERTRYAISADHESHMMRTMELAFQHGTVRIYRRRG